jgi:hypothetical protein
MRELNYIIYSNPDYSIHKYVDIGKNGKSKQ